MDLVVQKKKLDEVYSWFKHHFIDSTQQEFINKCPVVIFQGPTGCGKTTSLKWISEKLKVPIKEYSETTDTTAINHDVSHATRGEDKPISSQSIDRRKALKFELFITNSLRFNTLYSNTEDLSNGADSEFDSDDGFPIDFESKSRPKPKVSGVIIHLESPLSFARNQRIMIQTLHKILKIIKELSKVLSRRIAIVFETLEGESETIILPNRFKQSVGIQIFKFNPITRANMKKFIEYQMKSFKNIVLDKDTIDQLINDCDGDLRACNNTLQLICQRPSKSNLHGGIKNIHVNQYISNELSLFHNPAAKKQKLYHDKVKQVRLNPSLMRDGTRSLGFFHGLGKIFYQKRLYPEFYDSKHRLTSKSNSQHDRPYPTENNSEYLADMLGVGPTNLLAWLHQHYYKFCDDSNIDKAATFMDFLALTDTVSLNSTQTTQFYESHSLSDQIQTILAIESTVFSLYTDQSKSCESSHKKVSTDRGTKILKSSVDNSSMSTNGNKFYSFTKPASLSIGRLVGVNQALLDCFVNRLAEISPLRATAADVGIDYLPYLEKISENWQAMSPKSRLEYLNDGALHPIFDHEISLKILQAFLNYEGSQIQDFDLQHEKLLELVERIEEEKKA